MEVESERDQSVAEKSEKNYRENKNLSFKVMIPERVQNSESPNKVSSIQ